MATARPPITPAPRPAAAPQALNPQQVRQMQLVVKQAMQLLLQKNTADSIVAQCRQGDPAQTIARLVAPLLQRIHESAMGAGANVDTVTMMVAGVQIIGTLAEMLWHAGVIESEQQLPAFIAQACKAAVQLHNASGQQAAQQAVQPPAAPQPGGMLTAGAQ